MSTIKCHMLTYLEHVAHGDASRPVYVDESGKRYHLGNHTVTVDSGEELDPAPVGSMWNADWLIGCQPQEHGVKYDRNPDGIVLCVRTPGGDWLVDGPSCGGGSWSRTGTVPNVTVTPSILQETYHGWLRDGYLVAV